MRVLSVDNFSPADRRDTSGDAQMLWVSSCAKVSINGLVTWWRLSVRDVAIQHREAADRFPSKRVRQAHVDMGSINWHLSAFFVDRSYIGAKLLLLLSWQVGQQKSKMAMK